MQQIKMMPEQLANQIAAGEVVERPASVLKECIENSFDASADRIEVRLERSGSQYMSVKDNGCGIAADELELALCRHATSKITVIDDLHALATMGFRGEALASIASVAHVRLASKTRDAEMGWSVYSEGGVVVSKSPVNMAMGTRIEIEDLFFNTPARRRFMRSERTELGHIEELFKRLALSRPSVAMELIHQDRVLRSYPKAEGFLDQQHRLKSIFSEEWVRQTVPVVAETESFKLMAWVTRPQYTRAQPDWQYLFVNGRSIRDLSFAHAIKRAFADLLYQGAHPSWVCYLEVNPAWVDVNIHPTKDRVRFSEASLLMDWVYKTVRPVFHQQPKFNQVMDRTSSDFLKAAQPLHRSQFHALKPEECAGTSSPFAPAQPASPQPSLVSPPWSPPAADVFRTQNFPKLRPLCQINGVYLLAMEQHDICIIDIHAAHERLLLESLRDKIKKQGWVTERLLVPISLSEGWDERVLEQHRDALIKYGCVIELKEGVWFLSSHPKGLSSSDACDFLSALLEQFSHDLLEADRDDAVMGLLADVACRMAVKANRSMSPLESAQLLEQLEGMPEVCNHGRPWKWLIRYEELEHYFMRGR